MRIISFIVGTLFVCLSSSYSSAATHAVNPICTSYNGNGTSWACATSSGGVGAYNALPSALTRGDTYYLGDGTSDKLNTLSDAESGTTLIYIKKATESEHGPSTGWSSAYGDGTFTFTSTAANIYAVVFEVENSYYEVDGVTDYGIVVQMQDNASITNPNLIQYFDTASHITWKHVEFIGADRDDAIDYANAVYIHFSWGTNTFIAIQHSYIHHFAVLMKPGASDNDWSLEYSKVDYQYFRGDPAVITAHQQLIDTVCADRVVINGNTFLDSLGNASGEGIIALHGHMTTYLCSEDDYVITNNVFYGLSSEQPIIGTSSSACTLSADGWLIANNTFIGLDNRIIDSNMVRTDCGEYTGIYPLTNFTMKNNLFFDCANTNTTTGVTLSNNYYNNSSAAAASDSSSGKVVSTQTDAQTFGDSSGGDYSLVSGSDAIDAGTNLTSLFTTDFNGDTWPSTGAWDVGAILYTTGTPVDGVCGSNNGGSFSSLTSGDVDNCDIGDVSSFTGGSGSNYSWDCDGTDGGDPDHCTATYVAPTTAPYLIGGEAIILDDGSWLQVP